MMQEPYPPQKVVAATPVLVVVMATPVPESPGELDGVIVTALKLSGLALFLAIAIPVLGFILLVAVMGSRFLLLDFFRTAKKW